MWLYPNAPRQYVSPRDGELRGRADALIHDRWSRDGVVLGLSADAPIAEATSLYARYDGDLQGGNTSHIFSAGVRYVW